MIVKNLYRYERAPGKFSVSFEKPEGKEYTELFRLIAEEGKAITNDGKEFYACIDTDTVTGFYEVDESEVIHGED